LILRNSLLLLLLLLYRLFLLLLLSVSVAVVLTLLILLSRLLVFAVDCDRFGCLDRRWSLLICTFIPFPPLVTAGSRLL